MGLSVRTMVDNEGKKVGLLVEGFIVVYPRKDIAGNVGSSHHLNV